MYWSTITSLAVLAMGLVKADDYANFFDDDNCQVNGGIGVDINNDGCLAEAGRKSVYIPRTANPASSYCLVKTKPNGECSCQSEGYNFTPTGFCAVLDPDVQSYRFIAEACGGNNC